MLMIVFWDLRRFFFLFFLLYILYYFPSWRYGMEEGVMERVVDCLDHSSILYIVPYS